GNLGETGPMKLTSKMKSFETGQNDVFSIECPSVGEIHKILIAHDNTGLAAGWFLDRILIEDLNNNRLYEFPCYKWLAKDEDDKQIARILFPEKPTDRPTQGTISTSKNVETSYEIVVYTGDKSGAGTDSKVFITLFGNNEKRTQKIQLKNSNNKDPFEKNQVDTFHVESDYIGELTKLRIEHDNTGRGPGWFLDRIVVTDLKNSSTKYIGICNRWLAKDEDDGEISRDLILKKQTSEMKRNNTYKIIVSTGNQKDAGTDANVFITLSGNLGETGPMKLTSKMKSFETGQ
ncbi:unnamed protein product, partial [Rotaria sp. Silwood2]